MSKCVGLPLHRVSFFSLPPFFGSWFGFSKSCPQDIIHRFTVYCFRGRRASRPHLARCWLFISTRCYGEKGKRVEGKKRSWDVVVMKEGETARLEAGKYWQGGEENKVQATKLRDIKRTWRMLQRHKIWMGGRNKRVGKGGGGCIKEAEEECTCQSCATHPQAICSTTSGALHWLACHYILHTRRVFRAFNLTNGSICTRVCVFVCLFTRSTECHALTCVRLPPRRFIFYSQIPASAGLCPAVSVRRAHVGLVWP